MTKIFTIKINNKQYVHIDIIKYKNQILYHFGSLEDEIFCTKNGDEYIPISDEFQISIIKNKLRLTNTRYIYAMEDNNYEKRKNFQDKVKLRLKKVIDCVRYYGKNVYKLSSEEREKIVNEQIENFKIAKEKLDLDINLEEIAHKIQKVKYIKKDILKRGSASGYYKSINHSIALENKNDIDSGDMWYKRVRFHEHIHAITGKKDLLYVLQFLRGFLEGETENLTEAYLGDNTSSYRFYKQKDKMDRILFNFSENTIYAPFVSIVRQIEHSIGKKSYNSILKGNMEFEKEFAEKYGMQLMIFMAYRTRMLMAGEKINRIFKERKPFDEIKYFKETQDILMKKVFDKDFEDIKNIDDAKLYLQKLRDFETVRGRISSFDKEVYDFIEDTSFQEYYDKKYKEVIERIANKGIKKEEIVSNLEQFEYERQEFKPRSTEEEEEEQEQEWTKDFIVSKIAEKCIRNKEKIDINQYYFNYFRVLSNCFSINIVRKGTTQGYYISIIEPYESDKFHEIFSQIEDSNEREYDEEHDISKYLDFFKEKGYKEEKIEFADSEFQEYMDYELNHRFDINQAVIAELRVETINDENAERIKELQEENETIKSLLTPEILNEREKESLSKKIKRAKELIAKSKAQDKEIKELEKRTQMKGTEFNE